MSQYQQAPIQPGRPPANQSHGLRNALVAAGVAVVLLVGTVIAFSDSSGDGSPATSKAPVVVYQADGGAREASYTLRSDNGGTVQGDISLPLKNQAGDVGLTFTGFKRGDFVYLSIQNAGDSGTVTCRIVVDGVELLSNTSDGAYKIATCSTRLP